MTYSEGESRQTASRPRNWWVCVSVTILTEKNKWIQHPFRSTHQLLMTMDTFIHFPKTSVLQYTKITVSVNVNRALINAAFVANM